MKLFRKRNKGNNRGFSLVELVCAVAIFGVAATAIGSAMIVSAQSYSRGTYELDVQEEAQTATNIVGNLIFDAVAAKQVDNVVTIDGEGITYTITYDTDARTLNYQEDDGENVATGVLAENVTSFSTGLSENENDLKTDRNVKVEISIEKNGRTYEASYNTTARNGSADAVGVAESAVINVDSSVIIEPGQSDLELPVTVNGSVADKTFSVAKTNTSDPISVSSTMDCVKITATADAVGPYVIMIKTNAKDDANAPLDTKLVTVNVRRILAMGGNTDVTGTQGANGSSYEMRFTYTGTNLEKVYGRDYDTDYVDPRQFRYEYSITGAPAGETVNDYIDAATKVEQTGVSPSVSLKLKKELPEGAKIAVKCISKHSEYTNKSCVVYGPISKTLYIEKPRFSMGGKLNRGNDDNVENGSSSITIEDGFLTELNNEYDSVVKIIEMYEATIDAEGNFIRGAFAFDLRSDRPGDDIEGGDALVIRPAHSNRLVPNKAYVMVTRVECYKTGVPGVAWPIAGVTPESEYMCEFPISPVTFSYEIHDSNKGIETNYLELKKGTEYEYNISCVGLDLSRHQDKIKFEKRKKDTAEASYGSTEFTNMTCNVQFSGTDGSGKIKLIFQETGYYKITAKLSGYSYYNYDGSAKTPVEDVSLNDATNAAVLYIHVTEKNNP